MSALTQRQVAVLRSALKASTGACTTYLSPKGMTVAQTGAVCRQLDAKGFLEREPHYGRAWRITSSGVQWLRSLDAGRPWMVRGWAKASRADTPSALGTPEGVNQNPGTKD